MPDVVCVLTIGADQATFKWSEGPASFEAYTLDSFVFHEFKEIAEQSRQKLEALVQDYVAADENLPRAAFELAEVGYELYEAMFDTGADAGNAAKRIRDWLEQMRDRGAVDTFEIVVENAWSMPWNVVYDREPDEAAFLSGDDSSDRWQPFWGLRYNLCSGRQVDPLRRFPIFRDPVVLMVVDDEIRDGLPEAQQQRLSEFIERHNLPLVSTVSELKAATRAQRPDLLYWMSHAEPDALVLGGEDVSPSQLRRLLKPRGDAPLFGGLAFLNACQTAEVSAEQSFFGALRHVGFAGMIGTEQQTIDQFANPFGIDFLEGFLEQGRPVGELLRSLRGRVPLGLLYGAYCPPHIRVQADASQDHIETDVTQVTGSTLGRDRGLPAETQPLPPKPYRSLGCFTRQDRALFAGRDEDVVRFCSLLDDDATRSMLLHGESGVGKSSFLHAGVIPYLEEECLGYQFLGTDTTESSESIVFVRSTNDLFGQLSQALCTFCAEAFTYHTPANESKRVDLAGILMEAVGGPATPELLRAALRNDVTTLGRLLQLLGERLPFTPVLVIDQAEELFTLAKDRDDAQRSRDALSMIQEVGERQGDFKLILSLRTEYYGRFVDRLRQMNQGAEQLREYLLTDFDSNALVEAIERPTTTHMLPYSHEIPAEKYGFRFAEGVAAEIAEAALHQSIQRHDSVLPLVQVICAQLYEQAKQQADAVIRSDDLRGLGGVEGGMKQHVEKLVAELAKTQPRDQVPIRRLLTKLYVQQPDGSFTTALLPEQAVATRWQGSGDFQTLLGKATAARLLKANSLRIGGSEEQRYISLGHDALAGIAADWDRELTEKARRRRWVMVTGAVSAVAVLMACLALFAVRAKRQSEANLRLARQAINGSFRDLSEEELLNEPNMQPLRRKLLKSALPHYAKIVRATGGNAAAKLDVAETVSNLGKIQAELGQLDVAAARQEEAVQRLKSLPQTEAVHSVLGDAWNARGNVAVRQATSDLREEGSPFWANAAFSFEQAFSIREQLAIQQGSNFSRQRLLASTMMNLANARVRDAHVRGVLDDNLISEQFTMLQKAQDLRRELLTESQQNRPGDSEDLRHLVRRDLALGEQSIALLVFDTDCSDLAVGIASADTAVKQLQLLTDVPEPWLRDRFELYRSLQILGYLTAATGDLMSVEYLREARRGLQTLTRENPKVPEFQRTRDEVAKDIEYIESDADEEAE